MTDQGKPPEFCPSSRADWSEWLRRNHARKREVWLIYYKKHTGKPTVSYLESLEEALCFGWIDGMKKRIDEERYTHRFSPRVAGSRWSPRNLAIAKRLISEGRMARPGLDAYEHREEYPDEAPRAAPPTRLSAEVEARLRESGKAWANFRALAPGYRRRYAAWLMSARRPETLDKRIKETIELLEKNHKLGMK